eukprot:767469-Pelagomonas_calceolata.AAC.4
MSRGDVHQFDDSKLEDDQREQVNKDVHRNMQSGFSNMASLRLHVCAPDHGKALHFLPHLASHPIGTSHMPQECRTTHRFEDHHHLWTSRCMYESGQKDSEREAWWALGFWDPPLRTVSDTVLQNFERLSGKGASFAFWHPHGVKWKRGWICVRNWIIKAKVQQKSTQLLKRRQHSVKCSLHGDVERLWACKPVAGT